VDEVDITPSDRGERSINPRQSWMGAFVASSVEPFIQVKLYYVNMICKPEF
jgi:hypothetical protein